MGDIVACKPINAGVASLALQQRPVSCSGPMPQSPRSCACMGGSTVGAYHVCNLVGCVTRDERTPVHDSGQRAEVGGRSLKLRGPDVTCHARGGGGSPAAGCPTAAPTGPHHTESTADRPAYVDSVFITEFRFCLFRRLSARPPPPALGALLRPLMSSPAPPPPCSKMPRPAL